MPITGDRVKETTTSTGTGAITLSGAVSQHQAFSTIFQSGQVIQYAIVGQSSIEWEVGEGVLLNSIIFARLVVRQSSNLNLPVSFSAGTKEIFATFTAYSANQIDVLLSKVSDLEDEVSNIEQTLISVLLFLQSDFDFDDAANLIEVLEKE